MADWLAGLGAGLQSFGGNAMQYLAQEQARKEREAERERIREQQRIQNRIAGETLLTNRRALGYEDADAVDRRLKVMQALSRPGGGDMDAMTFSLIGGTMAAQDQRSLERAEDVTLPDGTTRRMALNPMRTPEARQLQQDLARERARRESALEEYKAKTTFENERLLGKRRGEYEALKRGGYIAPDEAFDPERDYTTDVALARLQATNQNRLEVARTPRVSRSTSTRLGGASSGSTASLDPAQRAQLRTAETNLLNAEDEYQRTLANRPEPDPMLTDEENAARLQRWARGDSTYAANRVGRMQQELGTVRSELGIKTPTEAPPPPPATSRSGFNLFGNAPFPGPSQQNQLLVQAEQAIAQIQSSNLPAAEKARRIAIIRQRMGAR